MRRIIRVLLSALVAVIVLPVTALAKTDAVPMYRLYNQWTGEHFYTASVEERDGLVFVGWTFESIGWNAPTQSNTPVYRLYNKWVPGGDHHYTTSASERDNLVAVGWSYEGIGWYSDDSKSVPVYRQYNPYAVTGTHNYTTNAEENDYLVSVGWRAEGIGWYGVSGSFDIVPVVVTHMDITNVPTTVTGGTLFQSTAKATTDAVTYTVINETWFTNVGDISDGSTYPEAGTEMSYAIVIGHPSSFVIRNSCVITINGQQVSFMVANSGDLPNGERFTAIMINYHVTTT